MTISCRYCIAFEVMLLFLVIVISLAATVALAAAESAATVIKSFTRISYSDDYFD